jgi:membrane protease subunit HflK
MNSRTITSIVASVIAITISLTSFFTVDPTETALVLRFGRHVRQVGPGLHIKMPLNIEKCLKIPVRRIFSEQFGTNTQTRTNNEGRSSVANGHSMRSMVTGDLNIVDVSWSIQYKIVDPAAWVFRVEDQKKTIRDTSEAVINTLIGDRALIDVMKGERDRIEREARELIESQLKSYQVGVQIITCRLLDVLPPAGEVIASFEDVNKAIQDRVTLINTGREQYNRYVPKARGFSQQHIFEAEGYAMQRINRATGESQRFSALSAEYERNPVVTRTRLYYESLNQAFEGSTYPELIDKNLSGSPFRRALPDLSSVNQVSETDSR